jgi:ParB family chromosome partitioning protein
MLGDTYVAIFSHQLLSKPQKPVGIEGIEGIVVYLMSLYTKPSNFVIAPFLGQGEVLLACERMGRICFAGDGNPERVERAITRWQKWTGKEAKKMVSN